LWIQPGHRLRGMDEHDESGRVLRPRVTVVAMIGLILLLSDLRAFEGVLAIAVLLTFVGGFAVVRAVLRKLTRPAIELSVLDLLIAGAIWRWHDRRRTRRLSSTRAHNVGR
jgi:hypothetical protein